MTVTMLIIGTFALIITVGIILLIKKYASIEKHNSRITIGIMGGVTVLIIGYIFISTIQCNRLKKYGFGYEKLETTSPTWDTIRFFYENSDGERVKGPLITGNQLKVKCRDTDMDGIPEFIIKSTSHETDKTLLKVDPNSGSYHVYSTNGLKVSYPKEGYYSH